MINEILGIFNWVKDKLPIQDRKERWRNEYDMLKKERADILVYKADMRKARRLEYIDSRLLVLEQLFKNQTTN